MSEAGVELILEPITEPTEPAVVEPTLVEPASDQAKNAGNSRNNRNNRFHGKKRYDGRSKRRGWEPIDRRGDDNDTKRVRINPEDRVKKRKYLMLLGFAGANYFGMQRNPDVNTIEEELLKAIHKNKLIDEDAFKVPQNIQFQRAARTDKGVSAARQCCSLKLPEEVNLEQLNADLPDEIKVFKLIRVTKGFNSKEKCDARSYSYTLPSISFAAAGSDFATYRIDATTLTKVNEALASFEGTHNFHNFTSKKAFSDPSAVRFIHEFKSGEPFIVDNVEFCELSVKGQSFMLHQIRKMVALAIAAVRGVTTMDTIAKSFEENRLDLPMAPGLGLVLNEVHYDRYNERYGEDGMHELLTWNDVDDDVREFRAKFIHAHITKTEITEQPMMKWVETLTLHSYSERSDEKEIVKVSEKSSNNDDDDE